MVKDLTAWMSEVALLVVLAVCCPWSAHGEAPKCELSKSIVKEGENVTLTCKFPTNVYLTHRDVRVYHSGYELQEAAETVFLYIWSEDGPSIETRQGCTFDGLISDTLDVKISKVKREHSGKYFCNFVPSILEITGCELDVTDASDSEGENINNDNRMKYVLIFSVCGALIGIILLISAIALHHRRKDNFKRNQGRESAEKRSFI